MSCDRYETAHAVLLVGDAREALATLAKESVDMVATDPPYGMGWSSNTRANKFDVLTGDGLGEGEDLLAQVADSLVRAVRRTRHIYSFGLPIVHDLLAQKAEIIWDKELLGPGDLSQPWAPSHEKIHFHVRASDRCARNLARGSLSARLRRGDVIRLKRLNALQVKRHPTEKPVALMRQLVESSSIQGETVLDPFAGSGSTLVAAVLAGRRAIGIEIDAHYAEIAYARLVEAERLALLGMST